MQIRRECGRARAVVLVGLLAAPLQAGNVQVQLSGSHVRSITSGSYVVQADALVQGRSSGPTTFINGNDFPALAADDLNLATYFSRNSVSGAWDVDLVSWWNTNGPEDDFFVFEVGGNDALTVQARFPNGALGQPVTLSNWTSTGYVVPGGPNVGQAVFGLGFEITQLKNPDGSAVHESQTLGGLSISAGGVDGASVTAVSTQGQTGAGDAMHGRPWAVLGNRTKWHPLEVWFNGPQASELDSNPNPFLDYRLQVRFTAPSGAHFDVPGFFDGNGQGNRRGNVWKARFSPSEAGVWTVRASFRQGPGLAVQTALSAGAPTHFDGLQVSFDVAPLDPNAPGFLRYGVLRHNNSHYLKFADGPHWLKGGTNSPENLLAYLGFDDIQDNGNMGKLHRYDPHAMDWQAGDPDWVAKGSGFSGRNLIGALNYLSSRRVNSVYFLPMNLGGDGQDVCPFVGQQNTSFDKTHYSISRLHQWNRVFQHAQRLGIFLHFVLAETEAANKNWLDGGNLGTERKLFYRELAARFSYLLALKWNLAEETPFSNAQMASFADYIKSQDAFGHPICFHSDLDDTSRYSQVAGDPRYQAVSMQYSPDNAGMFTEQLRSMSGATGKRWVIDMDENGSASHGLQPDNADDLRRRVLYDVYFSGGQIEWYFGYQALPIGGDVDVEDFRTREDMWDQMWYARSFMEQNLPFWQMNPMDSLLTGESTSYGGGEVFGLQSGVYAVYLPSGSPSGTLNLSGAAGQYTKRWYNPRTGAFEGSTTTVSGGGNVSLGTPPSSSTLDWVVLLKRI